MLSNASVYHFPPETLKHRVVIILIHRDQPVPHGDLL